MFTLDEIRYWSSSDTVYKRGEELYRSGAVPELRLVQEGSTCHIRAYVEGSSGDRYYNVLEIDTDSPDDVCFECECPAAYAYEGACKHTVAMMFKVMQEASRGNIRVQHLDKEYGRELLSYYEQQMIQTLEMDKYDVIRLEPKLQDMGDGTFGIGLQIGDKRMYVVKDIIAFVDAVREEKQVAYGKELMFVHHKNAFAEESRGLLEIVLEQVAIQKHVLDRVFGGKMQRVEKKVLLLTPSGLDRLFDLYKDKTLPLQDEYGTIDVTLEEANPKFIFAVGKKEDYFEVQNMEKHYQIIEHPTRSYIWMGQGIYLLTPEYIRKVLPVLKFMQEVYPPQLKFDEVGWKRFAMGILPKLKNHIDLRISKVVEEAYTPPNLIIRLYLDQDDDKAIVGHVTYDYDGYMINPYIYENIKTELARDVEKEHYFGKILEHYPFVIKKGKLILEEEEAIYDLFHGGIDRLLEICEVHMTDQLRDIKFTHSPIGGIGLKIKGNLLQLNLEEMRLSPQEVQDILDAYRAKKKYYRLTSGAFVDLKDEAIAEVDDILEGLDITLNDFEENEIEVEKYRALYLDHLLNKHHKLKVNRDKAYKGIVREAKSIEDSDYEVPEALKGILRSYQKTGYRWLRTMAGFGFGGVLADDMGLGKTLQVIALLQAYKDEEGQSETYKPSVVIAPTSLALNWEREFAKFTPDMKVQVISGQASVRERLLKNALENTVDVVITSYDLFKRDEVCYGDFDFKYCIADEAHYIKNPKTQNARAIKKVKSEVRFGLTGTPIENNLAELWSLFDYCMPGYLFSYHRFKASFETPIMRMQDEKAASRLQKMAAPFILRRLKRDVLKELPPKTETIVYNQMEEQQLDLYKAHVALVQKELSKELEQHGFGKSHMKILAMLTRLRQLCCYPGLYLENYEHGSGKLSQCIEIIQDAIAGGHKILLFSQFTSMLDHIGSKLLQEGIGYYMLTGQTKAEKRMEMVEAFNEDDTPVFLISLKAGGTGLNLTAADIVIHYDPWWNVSSENQATDRAYRIGQENPVQVYKLITKDSIEERIKELQDKKIGLADQILKEGQTFINHMTEEELKDLFN